MDTVQLETQTEPIKVGEFEVIVVANWRDRPDNWGTYYGAYLPQLPDMAKATPQRRAEENLALLEKTLEAVTPKAKTRGDLTGRVLVVANLHALQIEVIPNGNSMVTRCGGRD